MRRLIVVILAILILALPGAVCAQSEGELDFYQRRVESIRDPGNRRIAQMELDAAREALRQNNVAEFKRRGDNIMFIAHMDDVQYRR